MQMGSRAGGEASWRRRPPRKLSQKREEEGSFRGREKMKKTECFRKREKAF